MMRRLFTAILIAAWAWCSLPLMLFVSTKFDLFNTFMWSAAAWVGFIFVGSFFILWLMDEVE